MMNTSRNRGVRVSDRTSFSTIAIEAVKHSKNFVLANPVAEFLESNTREARISLRSSSFVQDSEEC